jgi:hypothetical protein
VLVAVQALELTFLILLGAMVVASGLIGLVVVVRVVEPAGLKALADRLRGKPTPNFRTYRTR